jgi:hypothetical protein
MHIMVCSSDWEKLVRVFSALLTPAIALLVAYIAWQQQKTSKNQFRLALFERRLKVFNSTGELIATVLRRGKVANDELVNFLYDTRENEFLFGPDIAAYLHELYGKASDVYSLEGATDEESKKQRIEALKWFSGQGDEAKKRFGIYMAFKKAD